MWLPREVLWSRSLFFRLSFSQVSLKCMNNTPCWLSFSLSNNLWQCFPDSIWTALLQNAIWNHTNPHRVRFPYEQSLSFPYCLSHSSSWQSSISRCWAARLLDVHSPVTESIEPPQLLTAAWTLQVVTPPSHVKRPTRISCLPFPMEKVRKRTVRYLNQINHRWFL